MPVFKKIAENKEWTRDIQAEFEKELAKSNVKTDGMTREDSGGKRTWAVYPKIFGLWYEDNNQKVVITQGGEIVARGGHEAVKQVRHQILRFQWPNRTQEHKTQKMDEGFKIFPYRFIIKLLLDKRIGYLLTSEIALFVLPVKTEDQIESVVRIILQFREIYQKDKIPLSKRKDLIEKHKELRPDKAADRSYMAEDHLRYIKDLANTFMNHLEIFEGIIHEKSSSSNENQIGIDPDSEVKMKDLIAYYDRRFPLSSIGKFEDVKWFVENYGNRYDRQKASRKTTKPKTKNAKDLDLVKEKSIEIFGEKASVSTAEIVTEISKRTGMNENQIKTIIAQNSEEFEFYKSGDNLFVKKYLQIAINGDKHEEFEEMTREIFRSFGFPTDKISISTSTGNQLEIDGFVQKNTSSGIIDAKSGKKFACGNKEVGIMKDYIAGFRKYHYKSTDYKLEFFAYIYGNKFENMSNLRRISAETKIQGAAISAHELLKLKEKFEQSRISKEEIWNLFKKNKEITSFDY